MQSISSLREAINKQQTDAESKRILADSLMKSADQHEANGDDVKAKLDRDSAQRYIRDIEGIEKTITNYESEITTREQKAAEIDKKIEDVKERLKQGLERLESDKSSLMSDVLNGSEIDLMIDQTRNKHIDKKEKELQKDFERDLQKLSDEKKLVLG